MKIILTMAATLLLLPLTGFATELVYTPINPSFGGNPLNGPVLMNSAQAQNDLEDPNAPERLTDSKSALQQFNEMLQRSILSRISTAVTGNVVDANGNLIPGIIQTTDFTIQIQDLGGGVMQITTTDIATGAVTSFQISN